MLSDIEQLEASFDAPANPAGGAIATRLEARLQGVGEQAPEDERSAAVRALLALSHHFYRLGELARAGSLLATADTLSHDLDGPTRVGVLLRRGEFELLTWDVGAALDHTSAALPIARAAGLRLEEVRVWTNCGMALAAAGLQRQSDEQLAHALDLLGDLDEPRLRCNIWALRNRLGFHMDEEDFRASFHACEQALHYARLSPPRHRDSMVCTAYCNLAALSILRNDVDAAAEFLSKAAEPSNLGARPRWLIAVLGAMREVRIHNGVRERGALDALLAPGKAPARVYVTETYSAMAAMYAAMGDAEHAHEALAKLAEERASALWATLSEPGALDVPRQNMRASPLGGGQGLASLGMLERLATTAELRDDATGRHCYRVGRLAGLLARRAGLSEAEGVEIDRAARLHDIGKFAIPDAILLKAGPLDAAEMHLMRTHTTIGADLLARGVARSLHEGELVARGHHEHWSGDGYPAKLTADSIPLSARIAALADVYDALSHVRPYKRAWSHQESLDYIRAMRGSQFDPRLTELFLAMMSEIAADLPAFLRDQEAAAAGSSYVVAETRISNALH